MADESGSPIRLTKANIKPAAEVLARAFYSYPVTIFFMPDEAQRRRKAPAAFRSLIRRGLKYGEVYATSLKLEGVAIWFPSGNRRNSWWQRFASGELLASLMTAKETRMRQRAFSRYSTEVRARCVPGRHWYLQILGVDPAFQGKGYSSRLLKPMLSRADGEGVPCFLETQSEKNVALYEHFGFRVAEEGVIPGSNVRSWAMVRRNEK